MEADLRAEFWTGDEGREPRVQRPCPCGCDERDGPVVGYLTASNEKGEGVTIYAPDEDTFDRMKAIFG